MAADENDVPIRPAATAVCLRDGATGPEVLLVRRTSKLVFYGGAWVFPGGRVDEGDANTVAGTRADAGTGAGTGAVAGTGTGTGTGAVSIPSAVPLSPLFQQPAARHAAVREALEETALVLTPGALVPISHWTTPPGRPRRFATWFFVTRAPDGKVQIDDGEIKQHRWWTPEAALAARNAGDIELPPPTFVTLTWARRFDSVSDALQQAAQQPLTTYAPRPVVVQNGVVSLYAGDAGYASQDPDADGARHRLSMLKQRWRYEQ